MGKGKGSGKGRGKGRANPPYSHMDWQTLASCSGSFDGENSEIQLHEEESEEFYVWSLCQKFSARTTHFFHSWFMVSTWVSSLSDYPIYIRGYPLVGNTMTIFH